jgi:tRNA A37 methylthiotransferase MiaB
VSAGILKKMQRGGDFKKNMRLVRQIRSMFPKAVLRSTFIVGFPGESEDDFKQVLEFAEEAAIERIGVFGFSLEENTASCKLPGRKKPQTIEKRKNRLLDISDKNLRKYNRALIGQTMDFLPLAPWTNGSTIGRIASQAPEVDGHCEVKIKFSEKFKLLPIKLTGFKNEMLFGENK